MEVAMEKENEIKKIEQDLSAILTQLKEKRSEIQQCEKEFEETLNAIKEKCLAESKQLKEIVQKYQKLFPESQQLLRQYFSLLSNIISLHEIQKTEDIEVRCQMLKRYSDEINNFFNGK